MTRVRATKTPPVGGAACAHVQPLRSSCPSGPHRTRFTARRIREIAHRCHVGRTVAACQGPSTQDTKKVGKTLKEKRAAKNAKKVEQLALAEFAGGGRSTPLTNRPESSVEYCLASSTASLMTTARRHVGLAEQLVRRPSRSTARSTAGMRSSAQSVANSRDAARRSRPRARSTPRTRSTAYASGGDGQLVEHRRSTRRSSASAS